MKTHRDRQSKSRVWIVGLWAAGGATLVGAVAGWGLGRVLDAGVDHLQDEGPIAVDLIGASAGQAIVPVAVAEKAETRWEQFEFRESDSYSPIARLASETGGHPVDLSLELVVSGLADHPVIVTDIGADDVRCTEPSRSDWVGFSQDMGGYLPALPLSLDLEGASRQAAEPLAMVDPPPGENERWAFPRQVSRAEADRFLVDISAPKLSMCTFRLRIDYLLRDERATYHLDRDFSVADEGIVDWETPGGLD